MVTNGLRETTNDIWLAAISEAEGGAMWIVVTFLLGIGNFALHKAVLVSRHPLLEQLGMARLTKITLVLEFAALLGALLLVAIGQSFWGWTYLGYSLVNGVSGWLILTRRI